MAFEIQAHRGARAVFPENTVPAFCHALSLGVRVLELDLVISKDQEIVVSHDPWLSTSCCPNLPKQPQTPARSIIYDMLYADIAKFDCGQPAHLFPHQQRIAVVKPQLSTVFREVEAFMEASALDGSVIYNLEIKSWPEKDGLFHPPPERYAELVVALVDASGLSERVRIQSFDDRVVRESWKLNPQLCYGFLVEDAGVIESGLQKLGFVPSYLNPHYTLADRAMVEFLHEQGIRMIPWTVNLPDDMLAMKQIGADGIITDYPDRAMALFSGND